MFGARPEDCAVPALLVPGGGAASCGEAGLAGEEPPFWAEAAGSDSRIAVAASTVMMDNLRIGNLLEISLA
jgi:hypothetical protein